MNVHADLSFVAMVANASIIVQAVMALLAGLSLWSWWQIFQKMFQLAASKRDADRFEDEFWKGGDLAELFQKASQSRSGGFSDNTNVTCLAPGLQKMKNVNCKCKLDTPW